MSLLIIYLHGLNSNEYAYKGQLLQTYCQRHCPHIAVVCPDLNLSPPDVMSKIQHLIVQQQQLGSSVAIVGSSLGGFFASLLYQKYQYPTVLINPSLYPHYSLQRLFTGHLSDLKSDDVLYTTQGGWRISKADVIWFIQHQPTSLSLDQTQMLKVYLKTGDEVLNYHLAQQFFQQRGILPQHLVIEHGGDHVMSDFSDKIPEIMAFFQMSTSR